jgi:hypothetical protein
MSDDLEALADEVHREHVATQRRPRGHVEHDTSESKERIGRPPRLSRRDEWELYCYRKSGVSIKTCASMWRVSVPTANRIIAKFREYDARVEPIAREFRDMIDTMADST